MDLAVQLYSIRKHFASNSAATLERLATIGYRAVEMPLDLSGEDIFGMGQTSASQLAADLASQDLKLIAAHLRLTHDDQLSQAIDYLLQTGCRNAVIPLELLDNQQQVDALADRLNALGEKLHKDGIRLFYHNHFHEFQRFGGQSAFDTLVQRTDPKLVSFEVDTYWAMRGGVDVLALLEQLGSRCGLIHQKDMPAALDKVDILADWPAERAIDLDAIREFITPAYFTEVGHGVMPVRDILALAESHCKSQAIVVEVDATDMDELDSVAVSYRNLSRLMGIV
ncbi:TIM barrel protein [Pseudomonas gingeri]|uniref:sugar phosphate isomerase/epimerase family protein n=1 Tax=Pseudomonas gingeri TaxID=117681 RepID=UPI0015A1BE73|nr:TIM barrel protein [Pseudomonas gingeri]NWD71184.1 TIM barrel protein [Pseudomonas gingeri]